MRSRLGGVVVTEDEGDHVEDEEGDEQAEPTGRVDSDEQDREVDDG